MLKSENIKNIAAALSKFQAEITNSKNTAKNPFFNSLYSPLNEVLNHVRPILAKNGLSVLQSPGGDGTNIIISTLLMHETGEWIESEPLVLKADKATAQGAGSAITYARRYALSAILGISSEDDDDGNHATGNQDKPPSNKPPTAQPEGTITESQAKRMFAIAGNPQIVQNLLIAEGYKKSTDVKKTEYDRICKTLENKGDK